jgi:hypothetical protein
MPAETVMQRAHRELVAAYVDWMREFGRLRSTRLHESLLPEAEQLDEALKRLLKALEPYIADK